MGHTLAVADAEVAGRTGMIRAALAADATAIVDLLAVRTRHGTKAETAHPAIVFCGESGISPDAGLSGVFPGTGREQENAEETRSGPWRES